MKAFKEEYTWELNSEDKFDPDAALKNAKTTGGTMVMWKTKLAKYVTVHPVRTTSFLPIIFSPPDSPVTVHIAIYLPTAGRDTEYVDQITKLGNCISDLKAKYEDCIIFIRGDGNTNMNNKERMKIFNFFLSNNQLSQVKIEHKTYHHFIGGGAFDSNIDLILHSNELLNNERVTRIFCKNEFPDMFSHHDAILSTVSIPMTPIQPPDQHLCEAPRHNYSRIKILWTDEGVAQYQEEVSPKLAEIRARWLDPLSKTSLSILLQRTNDILNDAAIKTNKSVDMNKVRTKSRKVPKTVRESRAFLLKIHRTATKSVLKKARNSHKTLVRKVRAREDHLRNQKLFSILSSDPRAAFSTIRSGKSSSSSFLFPHVMVGTKKYVGDKIIDGFYDSISNLKTLDYQKLRESPYHASLMEDYKYIKYLCSHKSDLPPVSLKKSSDILCKIKPTVSDFFSISARHFTNAGMAGFVHFNLLMNVFINDVNNCTIEELNTVFALLLYKSHGKDRTLDSSYRTISTCPLLAKGLDLYLRELFITKWNLQQASTQYQGESSNHELASLLITEAILHSKFIVKQPIYLLFLDAKSAFDTVVIPYLVRKLHSSGMDGHSILYMENRLSSRATFCGFDGLVAGPIHDEHGLEQGGVSSSDCYKLYNNELLTVAQESRLGVNMSKSLTISAVGQADDTVVLSNSLHKLKQLLYLVLEYCTKYNVKLSSTKTKLLQITPPRFQNFIPYNPIRIDGEVIEPTTEAEHVGVIRSVSGNLPNILNRVASFKKALGALASCGLAKGHRANPVATLRILSIYCTPVLMSGLGSLLLSSKEIAMVDQQYKRTLQNILKLSVSTPSPLVYFVAGSLPATAILHLRQLSIFGLVCRLQGDPLHQHAVQVLLTLPPSTQSWFSSIRNLLLQYNLPHPLHLLHHPPAKLKFKKMVKSHILDYWETKLRSESSFLPSLSYFHPEYLSLSSPHRLWSTAGQNLYEVSKAKIQLLFLSSQYPCAQRTRHWSPDNPRGFCSYPPCKVAEIVESREHILLLCPAYTETRLKLISSSLRTQHPQVHTLFLRYLFSTTTNMTQFLLDPSGMPDIIRCTQLYGSIIFNDIFYIGRTWCFAVHRERSKRLGKWNFM